MHEFLFISWNKSLKVFLLVQTEFGKLLKFVCFLLKYILLLALLSKFFFPSPRFNYGESIFYHVAVMI